MCTKNLDHVKTEIPEIKDAIFIVELNKFGADLIKIANLYAEIALGKRKHQENIEKSREALRNHDSRELAEIVRSFYEDARNYDENFQARHWLSKLNGRPFSMNLILFNPFHHNPELPNEENICNLIAAFNIYDDFFKNFLNTLYGDEKEGMEFLGRAFETVSSDYKNIESRITELSKLLPKSAPNKIIENIESKHNSLKEIMEKYPATLYLATRNILDHLENSTVTSLNPNSPA